MTLTKHTYDVLVIGGGPSGLMAAAAAGEHGAQVLLLDKGNQLGRKLAISGGGRCNVTNAGDIEFIIRNIPGNGRFLYSPFSVFNNTDIIHFFEKLGIALKEEDRGRMFPVSDRAKDVVEALIQRLKMLQVQTRTDTPVAEVLYERSRVKGVKLRSGESISAASVIVASGGMSVPKTGSTGDGYAWARAAGHTITELFPTEVPITSGEPFIQNKSLQGLSLRSITLSVMHPKNNKKIIEHEGDLIFTHFGVSGPVALRCSQFVVKALKQFSITKVKLQIDFFPGKSTAQVRQDIWELAVAEPKRSIKNVLKGFLPERMIPLLLSMADFPETTTFDHFPKNPLDQLARLTKEFPFYANGTLSIEDAFVTGGGVSLKEVEPQTLQSKLVENLYFCGEILDIHGYTGGYNITAAFSTGYTAGKSAAEAIMTEQN